MIKIKFKNILFKEYFKIFLRNIEQIIHFFFRKI